MDTQADIKWIHQEIDKVNDPCFIEKLKHLLQSLNSTSTVSDEEYNRDIEKALKNIEEGKFYTEEQVREKAKQWGRK